MTGYVYIPLTFYAFPCGIVPFIVSAWLRFKRKKRKRSKEISVVSEHPLLSVFSWMEIRKFSLTCFPSEEIFPSFQT